MFNNTLLKLVKKYPTELTYSINYSCCLTHKFIENNWKLFSINELALNTVIDLDFIEKHIDKFRNINNIWVNPNVINKVLELENSNIKTNQLINITKNFKERINSKWDKFKNCVNIEELINQSDIIYWDAVSINKNITIDLVRKYENKLIWMDLSCNQSIIHDLINEYPDKVCWIMITSSINLTMEFLEKYKNKIKWNAILTNKSLTKKMYKKYKSLIPEDWILLSSHPLFSLKDIENNIDKIVWYEVSLNPNLTMEFIEKYKNNLVWNKIWINQFNYYPEIIKKNKKKYAKQLTLELNIAYEKYQERFWKDIYLFEVIYPLKLRVRDFEYGIPKKDVIKFI